MQDFHRPDISSFHLSYIVVGMFKVSSNLARKAGSFSPIASTRQAVTAASANRVWSIGFDRGTLKTPYETASRDGPPAESRAAMGTGFKIPLETVDQRTGPGMIVCQKGASSP
jgi:hypothetical protein